MSEIKIPYIERFENENDKPSFNDKKSRAVIIRGDSGTGKTTFVKDKLSKIIDSSKNREYIIVMLNIIDDDITPSVFFDLLSFLLWNGNIFDSDLIINIDKNDSLNKFVKSKRRHKKFSKALYYSIQTSISMIPSYGAVISSNIEKYNSTNYNNNFDKNEILRKYLKKISRKKKIIISIDNYQFMLPQIRLQFESMLGSIGKNITLISIYRIDKSAHIQLPICFTDNRITIELDNFNSEKTNDLFYKLYSKNIFIDKVAKDCYLKTKGNLKEIELYIRKNHNAILNGTLRIGETNSLKNELKRLPDIQRYIIMLSTMFPSGVKIEYLFRFINSMYIMDNSSLIVELNKLVTLGYVIINSKNHDLLKPSHDRIGINFDKSIQDEEFIELYTSVEKTIEELIVQKTYRQDYSYLLHCLIGVSSFTDLQRNINYLVELICLEYNNCSYYYIVDILSKVKEIITYLPETTVLQVLDACQKSAEFSLGLEFYYKVKNNSNFENDYSIFAIKYLTQTYDFEQALTLLKDIPVTNESILYKLNILQHQGNDKRAQKIVYDLLFNNPIKDKWFYIILRNTAHYFNYKDAENNLNECLKYFEKNGSVFEIATIYNNLAVVQIWNGKSTFPKAKTNLKKSINKHTSINSNEIFEPYWNYSVLLFCEKNYSDALKYVKQSLEELPHKLELDIISIKINKWIFEYSLDLIELNELYKSIKSIFEKPIINKDPWVKFIVQYNLYNIETAINGFSHIEYDDYYLKKQALYTGFEVFNEVKDIKIVLSLSPNWRY